MNESINKELIFNYFSGRVTVFEKELIDQWSRDTAAKEQLFIWLLEWENQNLQYQADTEKAISRHQLHLAEFTDEIIKSKEDTVVFDYKSNSSGRKIFWMVAAATVLLVLSGAWLLRDHIRYEIYTTNFGQTKRLELADGSRVILNSNSALRIPRFSFGKTTRDVYMSGEANFTITHTKDHMRFIVHTDKNLDIEVLGTEFDVYARKSGARVVLNKGKVKLHYLEGQFKKQIMMKPGDLVTMDTKGHASLKKTETPQNFSAWKAHRFIFENASLHEICTLFEDNFGLKVRIPDATLAAQTISGSFTALSAEELLEILTDDSGLSYEKSEDGSITLDY